MLGGISEIGAAVAERPFPIPNCAIGIIRFIGVPASLFAGAETVVGVMGASMANSIFSGTGTHVVHLAPEGWLEPFYWDLAASRGHRYTAYFGSVGGAVGAPHTLRFRLCDEEIDALCASLI